MVTIVERMLKQLERNKLMIEKSSQLAAFFYLAEKVALRIYANNSRPTTICPYAQLHSE